MRLSKLKLNEWGIGDVRPETENKPSEMMSMNGQFINIYVSYKIDLSAEVSRFIFLTKVASRKTQV